MERFGTNHAPSRFLGLRHGSAAFQTSSENWKQNCSMKASTTGWGHHMEPRHVAHVAIAKTSRSKRLYLCYKRVNSLVFVFKCDMVIRANTHTNSTNYVHIQRHTSRMQNKYNDINHIHKWTNLKAFKPWTNMCANWCIEAITVWRCMSCPIFYLYLPYQVQIALWNSNRKQNSTVSSLI